MGFDPSSISSGPRCRKNSALSAIGKSSPLSARKSECFARELEARIDSRIDTLRSELLARIEAAKSDTIKWVIGIAFAQAATILAVLRLFPGPHG